jgi:hypothetical protein
MKLYYFRRTNELIPIMRPLNFSCTIWVDLLHMRVRSYLHDQGFLRLFLYCESYFVFFIDYIANHFIVVNIFLVAK